MDVDTSAPSASYIEVVRKQKAHSKPLIGVRFVKDPDTRENYFVTVAHDNMKVWALEGYGREHFGLKLRRQVGVGRCTVQDFDVSPTGRLSATLGVDGTLQHNVLVGDAFEPNTQKFNNGYMNMRYCAMIGDGYLTLSFKGALKIIGFDGVTKRSADIDTGHIKLRNVTAVAISTDCQQIALASNEGHVCLIEGESLKSSPTFEAHMKRIRSMAFLTNNERLLTACDDKTVRLHSTGPPEEGQKKPIRTYCGHTALVTGLAVDRSSGDKRFASCGNDKRCILWDVESGEKLHVFDAAYDSSLNCVAFSADGKYLAFGSEEGALFANELPSIGDADGNSEENAVGNEEMQIDDYPEHESMDASAE
ncbi:hypothetical protein QR680_010926 [Steinernema hermaphroditum]|uniref:Anaphase-promoting complex subunit 4 WD40 domain-containing protein n=1 Tax=Steinernema hermaphroditum TaxID=289476 RepID=A0AA39MCC4_9BILA|nr:hypothetical protein QR680_010926 [Steinernema hermaphroditum]